MNGITLLASRQLGENEKTSIQYGLCAHLALLPSGNCMGPKEWQSGLIIQLFAGKYPNRAMYVTAFLSIKACSLF